jgi:hypothetical protein
VKAVLDKVLGDFRRENASIHVQREPFSLVYAPVVHEHLAAIDPKYDSVIREKTEQQLTYEPDGETR